MKYKLHSILILSIISLCSFNILFAADLPPTEEEPPIEEIMEEEATETMPPAKEEEKTTEQATTMNGKAAERQIKLSEEVSMQTGDDQESFKQWFVQGSEYDNKIQSIVNEIETIANDLHKKHQELDQKLDDFHNTTNGLLGKLQTITLDIISYLNTKNIPENPIK